MRSWATKRSAGSSIAARSTPRASRASRGSRAFRAAGRAAAAVAASRISSSTSAVVAAGRGGAGGFDAADIFADLFGGGARAWRSLRRLRPAAAHADPRRGRAGRRHGHARRERARREQACEPADRAHSRGVGARRHRGWQVDPSQGAGPTGRQRRLDGRCDRHRDDRPPSSFSCGRQRPKARPADHALRGGARGQGRGADARGAGRDEHPGRHQRRTYVAAARKGPADLGEDAGRPAGCAAHRAARRRGDEPERFRAHAKRDAAPTTRASR